MRKDSGFTCSDHFAGCGGNGQAIKKANEKYGTGIKVEYALNHWKTATDSYSANFKETVVDRVDISATSPKRYNSTDMLISSPECTHQSGADGQEKPKKQIEIFDNGKLEDVAAERSRATMWDVPRFAEYHKYNYIIVENVVQVRKWIAFDAWLKVMHVLGYNHKCVYHNSKFSWPTPQSRDRIYIHFWRKGNKAPDLEYRPKSYCEKCGKDIEAVQTWKNPMVKEGVYGKRGQYVYCCSLCTKVVDPYYYAAFNCIDWNNPGTKISERNVPLKPGTIKRIEYGLEKLENWPFYIQSEHSYKIQNVKSLSEPFPTQATRQTLGIVVPFLIDPASKPTSGIVSESAFKSFIACYNNGSHIINSITDTLATVTTVQRHGILRYNSKSIEDCYYRMMNTEEGKAGMGFEPGYIVCGDAREQFIQLGNAVTPPAMTWQVDRAIQTFL